MSHFNWNDKSLQEELVEVEKASADGVIEKDPEFFIHAEVSKSSFEVFTMAAPNEKAEIEKTATVLVKALKEDIKKFGYAKNRDEISRVREIGESYADPEKPGTSFGKTAFFFECIAKRLPKFSREAAFFHEQSRKFRSYEDLSCFTTKPKYGGAHDATPHFDARVRIAEPGSKDQKFWAEQSIRSYELMGEDDPFEAFMALGETFRTLCVMYEYDHRIGHILPLYALSASNLARAVKNSDGTNEDAYRKSLSNTALSFGSMLGRYPLPEGAEGGEMMSALKELIYAWYDFGEDYREKSCLEGFLRNNIGWQTDFLRPFAQKLRKELFPDRAPEKKSLLNRVAKKAFG